MTSCRSDWPAYSFWLICEIGSLTQRSYGTGDCTAGDKEGHSWPQLWEHLCSCSHLMSRHGIMGRRFPDGGLLRYRKWVPQQLGDVNKQWSGDSRPMGARHGDTAANHTDLQSGCGRTCVFAVRVWSNLWELIWLRTSHYSMDEWEGVNFANCNFKFFFFSVWNFVFKL